MTSSYDHWLSGLGAFAPWADAGVFLAASLLMVWRLEAMQKRGVEGTVLGTLFMPYLSGLGNLLLVFVMLKRGLPGTELFANTFVNNLTNLTLLLGLPAFVFGLTFAAKAKAKGAKPPKKSGGDPARLGRLSVALSLLALLIFTSLVWLLGRDGKLDFGDGASLIVVFLFWQAFHVFEVLKENARGKAAWSPWIVADFALLLGAAFALYLSVDWIVGWITSQASGLISKDHLGLATGFLMVLPNALLAFYYAAKGKTDVVYASQVGDAHICIPLCLGLYAVERPLVIPVATLNLNLGLLAGAGLLHFVLVGAGIGVPRWLGGLLVVAYAAALIAGFA